MYKKSECFNAQGLQPNDRQAKRAAFGLKDMCVLYVISWVVLPILSSGLIFRLLAFACCCFFLISVIPRLRGKILNYFLMSVALVVMFFGITFIFEDNLDFAVSRMMNLIVFVFIGLFSMYYYEYERSKLKVFSFYIVSLFIIITIPSLIALQSNQYVMRNASGLTVRTGIERFAGSYGYVYGCVILETILVYDAKNNRSKGWKKFLQILVIVLIGYLILNAGYTTAIILAILGIVMALGVKKSGLATIIIFGIIGVVLISVIPVVLEYIFENFDIPQVYQQKLAILIDMTDSSGDTSYTDSTRGQLLMRGLDAIFEYPILGSVILSGKRASGGHQELVDAIANYGLLYAIAFYYTIYYTAIRQLKSEPKLKLIVGLLLLALGFTNTYDYTTFIVPLLIGPYIAERSLENPIKNHIYEEKVEKENVQL